MDFCPLKANLSYDPDAEVLYGMISGTRISMRVASGGYRGSTKANREQILKHISMDCSNPKAVIPPGIWGVY